MELEFDKEIDAILRKVRDDSGIVASDGAPSQIHIDADAISAFAENALPETAKSGYIAHFADCTRCRNVLSSMIRLQDNADISDAPVDAAPLRSRNGASWLTGILRSPGLAFAMGAVVLAFTGILGYLAVQERINTPGDSMSKASSPAANAMSNTDLTGENARNLANTATASNAAAANTSSAASSAKVAESNLSIPSKPSMSANVSGAGSDKDLAASGAVPEMARPMAAPPPPVTAQAKTDSNVEKSVNDEKAREESRITAQSPRDIDGADRARQDPRSKQLKRNDGPSRTSGQIQQENVNSSGIATVPRARKVAGRNFSFRNGVWYDSSYKGQATIDIRRGSEDYNKLEKDVRSIAEAFNAPVVVVKSSKAYRIQ
jgi:hypothetical protein